LAGLNLPAEFIDIAATGISRLPQVVGGRFSLQCHFVQNGSASVAYLVLMRLHAIQEPAGSRRDGAAIFLDVFATRSLYLFDASRFCAKG